MKRIRLSRWLTAGTIEWLLILLAFTVAGLVGRAGAPRPVGLAVAIGLALLVRRARQRGLIDRTLRRFPGRR